MTNYSGAGSLRPAPSDYNSSNCSRVRTNCLKIPNIILNPAEPVTPESCGCHKPPHDLDFDFSTAVVKVLH